MKASSIVAGGTRKCFSRAEPAGNELIPRKRFAVRRVSLAVPLAVPHAVPPVWPLISGNAHRIGVRTSKEQVSVFSTETANSTTDVRNSDVIRSVARHSLRCRNDCPQYIYRPLHLAKNIVMRYSGNTALTNCSLYAVYSFNDRGAYPTSPVCFTLITDIITDVDDL